MGDMKHSTFKTARLSSVFRAGEDTQLSARIARLCVLYEDLRIEMYGMVAETLPDLDRTDADLRRHYFIRRSIATALEFADALKLLDGLPDFGRIKDSFDPWLKRRWDKGLRFFRAFEPLLRRVRNDIGGHLGNEAATYSVQHLLADAVCGMWVERTISADRRTPSNEITCQ
jgi:hypothetical protein